MGNELHASLDASRAPVAPSLAGPQLLGSSAPMRALLALLAKLAPLRATVLITGESGTGKELIARALHEQSSRRGRFVAINCGALPPGLLEAELFGYVKGAYTDARHDARGLFESAAGGTLFLDEIAELSSPLQAKLLRVLQDGEVRRVGATQATRVDVRVVAATHAPLATLVDQGRFREDLYYRLNVLQVEVPPLRARRDDIPLLVQAFGARVGDLVWTREALAWMSAQAWPGNVRELENAVERVAVYAMPGRPITLDAVVSQCGDLGRKLDAASYSIKRATRALEQALIRKALAITQGNRTNAAKLLEISHRALLYKIKAYGIARDDHGENLDK